MPECTEEDAIPAAYSRNSSTVSRRRCPLCDVCFFPARRQSSRPFRSRAFIVERNQRYIRPISEERKAEANSSYGMGRHDPAEQRGPDGKAHHLSSLFPLVVARIILLFGGEATLFNAIKLFLTLISRPYLPNSYLRSTALCRCLLSASTATTTTTDPTAQLRRTQGGDLLSSFVSALPVYACSSFLCSSLPLTHSFLFYSPNICLFSTTSYDPLRTSAT